MHFGEQQSVSKPEKFIPFPNAGFGATIFICEGGKAMDRDAELTAYLLHHLHENAYFETLSEMATFFGISTRHLRLLMNNPERCKGGTIALSKVLNYFGSRRIPFDPVLIGFFEPKQQNTATEGKAYTRLNIAMPDGLSDAGRESFKYCRSFIQLLSLRVCPNCSHWCEPWDGREKLSYRSCFVAQTAKALTQAIMITETQRT